MMLARHVTVHLDREDNKGGRKQAYILFVMYVGVSLHRRAESQFQTLVKVELRYDY